MYVYGNWNHTNLEIRHQSQECIHSIMLFINIVKHQRGNNKINL
jgi:hypothetical protein